jgi:hypothetical protein
MTRPPPSIPAERIDEIPTSPSVFKARMVAVAVLMLAGLGYAAWAWSPAALDAFLARNPAISALFAGAGQRLHPVVLVGRGLAGPGGRAVRRLASRHAAQPLGLCRLHR